MTLNKTSQYPRTAADLSPRVAIIALSVVMVAGVALRVHRIGTESAWWDEYTSLMHLGAPNLWAFLRLNRTLDPATLPLYYAIEYLSSRWMSNPIVGLRLVSIFIGMLGVPLLYVLGRDLHSRTAGLVAALCLCLSPIHTFHAQGIRMYVLMNLLALVSAWSFLKVLAVGPEDGRRRWWAVHLAGNLLLVWTHPFALLLLAVEGAFLLLFRLRQLAQTAAWIALHALVLIPSALYLATVRFWSAGQTGSWLKLPTPLQFLGDLIADDVISMTYQLRISERVWPALLTMRPLFDAALVILSCTCILGLGSRVFRPPSGVSPSDQRVPSDESQRRFESFAFLAMWLLLPALTLYVASSVWRPCIFPRYTLHSSLALYLITGIAIAGLEGKNRRALATGAVVLLYGYQAALVYPGPQRTDWRAAGRIIKAERAPDDVILVHVSIWKDVFLFNTGPIDNPVSSAETLEVLADQAAFVLDLASGPERAQAAPRNVWAVILSPYFDAGPNKEFEACLAAHDLAFSMNETEGIAHILVYRIGRGSSAALPRPDAGAAVASTHDYVEAYGNLAMAFAQKGEYDNALRASQMAIEADPSTIRTYGNLMEAIKRREDTAGVSEAVRAFLKGHGFRENGRYDFAAEEFRRATECDPEYATAFAELGSLLAQTGDHDGALSALGRAVELHPPYMNAYDGLITALEEEGDVAAAVAAVRLRERGNELRQDGALGPAIDELRQAISLNPGYALAHAELGMLLAQQGDPEGALHALRRALEIAPTLTQTHGNLMRALDRGEDPAPILAAVRARTRAYELQESRPFDAAIAELRRAIALDPAYAQAYAELGLLLSEQGDYDDARIVLHKAIEIDSAFMSVYGGVVDAIENGANVEAAVSAVREVVRAYQLRASGQLEQAVAAFTKAAELDPNCRAARHALATSLLDQQDYEAALPVLQGICASSAADAIAYGHLADVIDKNGDVNGALDALHTLLEGFGLGETGDYAGLMAAARKAIEIDDAYGMAHAGLALGLLEQGNIDGFLAAMRRAFDLDPHIAACFEPLVVALFETKDYDAAHAEIARIERMGVEPPGILVEKLRRESGGTP